MSLSEAIVPICSLLKVDNALLPFWVIFWILPPFLYLDMVNFWRKIYTLSFEALLYFLQLWLITSTLGSSNSSDQKKIWFSFLSLTLRVTQSITPYLMPFHICIFKMIAISTLVLIIVEIVHGVSSFKMAIVHGLPSFLSF